MSHREDKKEAKTGTKKNKKDEAITEQSEMKKKSTKGIIGGSR